MLVRISTVFLFICFSLVSACGDKSDAEYVESARALSIEGKSKQAVIELKNALQKNGNNVDARWLLGNIYFESRAYFDAAKELGRADELGKSANLVYPLLAQSLLEINELGPLLDLTTSYLEGDSLATVLAAQGVGHLRRRNLAEATTLIERALVESPNSPYVLLANARLVGTKSKGNLSIVKDQLEKVVEIDPENAVAWGILGDIELKGLQEAEATKAYTKAIENNPSDLEARLKRALLHIQQEDFDSARKDVDELVKHSPKSTGTQYVQGILSFHDGNTQNAISFLEFAQGNEERYPHSLLYLALSHNQLGNTPLATEYAYRYLSLIPGSVPGRKLLSLLRVRDGEYFEAEELIRPVVEQKPDDPDAANILAGALLKQNKNVEGLELISAAAKAKPNSAISQLRLAVGFLVNGDSNKGLEHIDAALKLDSLHQQANFLKASVYSRQGEHEKALQVAQEFQKKNTDEVVSHNFLGYIHLAAQEKDKAKEEFQQAFKKAPGNIEAGRSLAYLAIQAQDFSSAKKYYETILKYNDNLLEALLKLAALSEQGKDIPGMVDYLESAVETHPKELQPRLMLARYHLSKGEPEKVATLLSTLDQKQKGLPEVLHVQGLSQLARNLNLDAKESFQKLLHLKPDTPKPHHYLGLTYKGLGQLDMMKSEFEKALELAPSYLPPRIELTKLLLQRKEKEIAIEHLGVLKELAPDNPEVLQLDAIRARLDGNQEEALALLKFAFEKAPSTRNMLVLTKQYWIVGQKQQSRNVLKAWLEENPKDVFARLELADMYLMQDEQGKASDEYEQVLELHKDNILALNNLAWLLRDKKPEQALKYAQQAVDQSQEAPLALDTLAVVLLKNNESEKALRTIDRALEKLPDNPSIKYHNAMINAEVGDKAKAKKYITGLLSEDISFPEKADAEKLLAELKKM